MSELKKKETIWCYCHTEIDVTNKNKVTCPTCNEEWESTWSSVS